MKRGTLPIIAAFGIIACVEILPHVWAGVAQPAKTDANKIQGKRVEAPTAGDDGSALVYINASSAYKHRPNAAASVAGKLDEATFAAYTSQDRLLTSIFAAYTSIERAGGGGTWGSITGTLSDQTDLNEALGDKVDTSVFAAYTSIDRSGVSSETFTNYTSQDRVTVTTFSRYTAANRSWGTITGTLSDQTDLQNALNAKQATVTGGATTITGSDLTASRALVSNTSGKVAASSVTSTELSYLSGVTSSVQTQFTGKIGTSASFGGDVSGTYGAIVVGDDTHNHTSSTIPSNSFTAAGLVTSGAGNASKVWKTDGSGNPAWRDDLTGSSPTFDTVGGGTNTSSTMTLGSGGTLTYSGTGVVNASKYKGETGPSAVEFAYLSDLESAILEVNDVVNNLTAGGTAVPLSAEQGRTLNTAFVNYTSTDRLAKASFTSYTSAHKTADDHPQYHNDTRGDARYKAPFDAYTSVDRVTRTTNETITGRKTFQPSATTTTSSVYINRDANYTGGDAGYVNSGLYVFDAVRAGTTAYEWAITGVVDNYGSGENVGVYAQGRKSAASTTTWGGVSEAKDFTADNTGTLIAHEFDIEADGDDVTGTDNSGNRVGLDVFAKRHGESGTAEIGSGLRLNAVNNSKFRNGIKTRGEITNGIVLSNTGTIGIDISGATLSGNAIKLSSTQTIGDGTNSYTIAQLASGGAASPLSLVADGASSLIFEDAYGTASVAAVNGRKSNGSLASPTAGTSGQTAFRLSGFSTYDTSGTFREGGRVKYYLLENWSASAGGMAIEFDYTPIGATSIVPGLTIGDSEAVITSKGRTSGSTDYTLKLKDSSAATIFSVRDDGAVTSSAQIESTSGGFKLPDGTIIDAAADLGGAGAMQYSAIVSYGDGQNPSVDDFGKVVIFTAGTSHTVPQLISTGTTYTATPKRTLLVNDTTSSMTIDSASAGDYFNIDGTRSNSAWTLGARKSAVLVPLDSTTGSYQVEGYTTTATVTASGTYTPTAVSVSNLDSTPTPTVARYIRVGNTVTVAGRVSIDPTAGAPTSTTFNLSTPITTSFTQVYNATGPATSLSSGSGFVRAATSSSNVLFNINASNTSAFDVYYQYSYDIE